MNDLTTSSKFNLSKLLVTSHAPSLPAAPPPSPSGASQAIIARARSASTDSRLSDVNRLFSGHNRTSTGLEWSYQFNSLEAASSSPVNSAKRQNSDDDQEPGSLESISKAIFQDLKVQTMAMEKLMKQSGLWEVSSQDDFHATSVGLKFSAKTTVKLELKDIVKFVNANFITVYNYPSIIAAQGPTNSYNQYIFWKMSFIYGSLIIDLRSEALDESELQLSKPTYPQKVGDSLLFKKFRITCLKQMTVDGNKQIVVSTYNILNLESSKQREITKINYLSWAAGESIPLNELQALLNIYTIEESLLDKHPIILCENGMGSTGTFIAAKTLDSHAQRGLLDGENLIKSLRHIILSGRKQRGSHFVQSAKQLQSLLEYGTELTKAKQQGTTHDTSNIH